MSITDATGPHSSLGDAVEERVDDGEQGDCHRGHEEHTRSGLRATKGIDAENDPADIAP
jgi:hypothetical protein